MVNRIIIADDSLEFINSIKLALGSWKGSKNRWLIDSVSNLDSLKEKLSTTAYDCLLLDLVFDAKKPDVTQGMDILPEISKKYPALSIVIMTNFGSIDKATEAFKYGAKDFIDKSKLILLEWENRLNNYCELSRKTLEIGNQNSASESDIIKKYKIDLIRIEKALVANNGIKNLAADSINWTPDRMLYFIKKKVYVEMPQLLLEYPLISTLYNIH